MYDKMVITIENFDSALYEFKGQYRNMLRIVNENADIGGGKLTFADVDILSKHPEVEYVCISGLQQDTFDYFIERYAHRLKGIYFFKNKLVEDWSAIATLDKIEFIYFFHNQRITELWDMSGNASLQGLKISDFTRLKTLKGIEKAPSLKYFSFGDAVWQTSVVDSYLCFANSDIEILEFYGKKIEDENFSFIETMPHLKRFECATNLLSTETVAWITANYPHISGYAMCPTVDFDNGSKVIIVGKRKPVLDKNDRRVETYISKYKKMQEEYKSKTYHQIFSK